MDRSEFVSTRDLDPLSRSRLARQRMSVRGKRELDGLFEALMAAGGIALVLLVCLVFYTTM